MEESTMLPAFAVDIVGEPNIFGYHSNEAGGLGVFRIPSHSKFAMNPGQLRYSFRTHVGNWYEEMRIEEEALRKFYESYKSGSLELERARKIYSNFHTQVNLSHANRNIYFGSIVQIRPFNFNVGEKDDVGVSGDTALTVGINERVLREYDRINEDCEVTLAQSSGAMVRNTFKIVGAEDWYCRTKKVTYGEPFRLQCLDSNDGDLIYLWSALHSQNFQNVIKTQLYSTYKHQINFPVGLIAKKNLGTGNYAQRANSYWSCECMDARRQLECFGQPIPSISPLILNHVTSNRKLTFEPIQVETLFGNEYLVSCEAYKDVRQSYQAKQIWMICNTPSKFSVEKETTV